ncbi:ABC-2 type transport system permease protein [Parabacteroides sp. PF5-5]|uniref:ABC transporter permease n=1 Tax=unclassified Parabacteroides TaxID=2649774 RepID=UPI002475C203|nr:MULTISPECIES: ABC transporter permease [unclassified Parabacteroides]MDH6305844.1 ABC-2 type transport system permease protein [Parabacteroides sp. PH5-39]MDH6317342.1 ABC-2 type transport system permease protein [Parabacteroides sp. PF5-13]MDH6320550.1 ABC-2 type transport system permease protein [Parabacteroides sp. PH5-13]MDH6324287.1 ABC-2 type transport system permease protein [Parabacteroides sp. PH5-8]MDH6328484.1 ABC-2 type transport system permease protein [Parabacteroides sp. PH5-
MKQFISFIRKEFYHIFRDIRTTIIILVIPIVLIILFGYAISTEIKSTPMAVLDYNRDNVTTKLIEQLQASEYFDLYTSAKSYEEVESLFRQGKIKIAIIPQPPKGGVIWRSAVSPPFRGLGGGLQGGVQILVDATDPNEATLLVQYATAIIASSGMAQETISVSNVQPGITPTVSLLYNPQMKGAYNFVPGVMGLVLILICALMTSVGIVREKELGTMEVLLVSPLKPVYIILAKAVPYLLISIINIGTILFLSRFLLDVPIVGSLWLLVALSILYAIVSLCLGLLISTITDTQQAAMLISGMVLMLPVMLLSGMIFPIENMPWILQILSNIVPAKWYIIAVKDVMIKGLGLEAILPEVGILLFMALFIIIVSVKRFKIRLA